MYKLAEEEQIYFKKTKEYFNEIMSDYSIGNYRAAIVMLYAVAICDLLFKLRELQDMYDDTVAKRILDDIERMRLSPENQSKSKWEKELVDRIFKETELLDLQSYTELNHLHDYRNFSAHPALNENFELISPTREITIGYMRSILEQILIKPPVFAKNIVNMMTEDIASKKEVYKNEMPELKKYIRSKYIIRMSEPMKFKVFRAFWKFCFLLPDDENCKAYRFLNRRVLEVLYEESDNMIEHIKGDSLFSDIPVDSNICMNLCIFLSRYPEVYVLLSDDAKMQIKKATSEDETINMISWFTVSNKTAHIKRLNECKFYGVVDENAFNYIKGAYEVEGLLPIWIDYCIENFRNSASYNDADKKYAVFIAPMIEVFSRDQCISLLSAINENDQIYGRNDAVRINNEIVKTFKSMLGKDFNYDQYPNFKYTIDIRDNINEGEVEIYEDEIPFY